jgi:glycolate oxidase iron-sulfur subunit
MGGAFGIRYEDLAQKIADKKAVNIKNTGAEIVGTSCPGCMIQLTEAVKRNRMDQKVRHIMELLQ